MNRSPQESELLGILRDLADELDVPPSKYKEAQKRYRAVGDWLNDDSALKSRGIIISPQGSFALGTVIKPLSDQDYDVDALCRVNFREDEITQKDLKDLIGNRLKSHGTYSKLLDPEEGHRRCWRITYADGSQFHLDLCPAIPDDAAQWIEIGVPKEQAIHSVCITDKETWAENNGWPKSNPGGYVLWFKDRMRTILNERLEKRALEKQAKVEDVEDYEVRTPLQRLIQLLKRHRDVRYGDDEDRPISIIITTLAAKAYRNEADIESALLNVVPNMRRGIEERAEGWWIPNPVNPQENFADKWIETPRKAELFFEWLETVEREHRALLTPQGFEKVAEYLTEAYGAREASSVMTKFASRAKSGGVSKSASLSGPLMESVNELTTFNVPQRQLPSWPKASSGSVSIAAEWKKTGGWRSLKSNGAYVKKGSKLRFRALTTVDQPFEIYWQVVNTGKDARAKDDLRGDIFQPDDEPGSLIHEENAEYRGRHWIECFIVKDGRCVVSGEFIVNIA